MTDMAYKQKINRLYGIAQLQAGELYQLLETPLKAAYDVTEGCNIFLVFKSRTFSLNDPVETVCYLRPDDIFLVLAASEAHKPQDNQGFVWVKIKISDKGLIGWIALGFDDDFKYFRN